MGIAACGGAGRRVPGFAQRKVERVLLIRHHAVHPDRHDAVNHDRAGEKHRAERDSRLRLGVARRVEVAAPCEQRDRDEARRDRAVPEAMLQVEEDERAEEGDCDLPCAPFPAGETARDDEQDEADQRDQRGRDAVHAFRGERADQRVALVREHCVEQAEQPRGGDEAREDEWAARASRRARTTGESAGDPRQSSRDVDRLPSRSRMERLISRHLADDQK